MRSGKFIMIIIIIVGFLSYSCSAQIPRVDMHISVNNGRQGGSMGGGEVRGSGWTSRDGHFRANISGRTSPCGHLGTDILGRTSRGGHLCTNISRQTSRDGHLEIRASAPRRAALFKRNVRIKCNRSMKNHWIKCNQLGRTPWIQLWRVCSWQLALTPETITFSA